VESGKKIFKFWLKKLIVRLILMAATKSKPLPIWGLCWIFFTCRFGRGGQWPFISAELPAKHRSNARLLGISHGCWRNLPKIGDEDEGHVMILDDTPGFSNFRSLLATGVVLFFTILWKYEAVEGTSKL
jgi:hypothetical protein